MATSTADFLVLLVGMTLVLGGAAGFVATAEDEYVLTLDRTTDSVSSSTEVTKYDLLLPERKAMFNRTVAEGAYVADRQFYFPEVVLRDGTYYHFSDLRRYEWGSPRTFVPLLVVLLGAGIAASAVRRDVSK